MGSNGNYVQVTSCTFCEDTNTKKCIKCQRFYCILHSSRISPQLCQECFASVSVTIDKYTKVTEDYDSSSDSIVERKSSCKRIRLDGPDFVWYSVSVQQATELELGNILEFHKFMVSLIESIKTEREVSRLNKLRDKAMPVPMLSTETTTRTKQRKTIKQQKTPREILAMSGITEATPGFASLLAQLEAAAKK